MEKVTWFVWIIRGAVNGEHWISNTAPESISPTHFDMEREILGFARGL